MTSNPRDTVEETDDDLVDFLLEVTGETLYIVAEYDRDGVEFSYVSDVVAEQTRKWEDHVDEILDQFRDESARTTEWEDLFDVGESYCSVHLFDELLVMHFDGDERGVIFGYDPAAASNLTSFVELCLPEIQRYVVEGVPQSPSWTS